MKITATAVLLGATLAAPIAALADSQRTVLASLDAPVMVNQGDSYRSATQGMALQAGDRLMVMNGGAASVAYPNGCILEVGANEMVRIDTGEACATTAASAGTYGQAGAPTGGAGGGGGGGTGALLGLGAVAGVIALDKIIDSNEDDLDDISR